MAGVAADPIGDVGQAAANTANGVKNTATKALSSTYNYVVKPAALTYGVLSAYSWFDGGVGALANLGEDGATIKDMLQVPLEGLAELSQDIGGVAEMLTSFAEDTASSELLNQPANG